MNNGWDNEDTGHAGRAETSVIVYHGEDYALTDRDFLDALEGRAVYITARAFAVEEHICRTHTSSEAIWYYVADAADPYVVSDILIPRQRASSSSVSVEGGEVFRCAREARQAGGNVVGQGHTHCRMNAFVSRTDSRNLRELHDENCGFCGSVEMSVESSPLTFSGNQATALIPEESTTVEIAGLGENAETKPAEDARLTLRRDYEVRVSTFTTGNYYGERCAPTLRSSQCPACGGRTRRFRPPEEVTIHVIGTPPELSEDEAQSIDLQLSEKIDSTFGYYGSYSWANQASVSDVPGVEYAEYKAPHNAKPAIEIGAQAVPVAPIAMFELCFAGKCLGNIDARVLSSAIAQVPELAEALNIPPEAIQDD